MPASKINSRGSRSRIAVSTLTGLIFGVLAGVLFGEFCGKLSIVGDAFVGLLRMTVMPYIIVSLMANLGRLSARQTRRLAFVGGMTMVALWSLGLVSVFALAQAFPDWQQGSFYSTSLTDASAPVNLVELFIPANVFTALAENHVPAVVLFSICFGLALSTSTRREALILQLDIWADALLHISHVITKFSPIGVFAIAASAAGTISLEEFGRLQVYLLTYTAGVLILTFLILPYSVTCFTSFRYRDVMFVARDSMLTAFATGKLIIVLPMLVEATEKLFARENEEPRKTTPAVDVLYPLAYSFPHVGKLLSMLFIPFAAWFLGNDFSWFEYPKFLSSGLVSYFGGPLLAIPFLLDLTRLPHDMFQLFLLTGIWEGRLGDSLGAMHLTVFTLISTCAFTNRLKLSTANILKCVASISVLGACAILGLRPLLALTLQYNGNVDQTFSHMQLLEKPVKSEVQRYTSPNPVPLLPGESLLRRIRRRDMIRVGYNEDTLPFAYFNTSGDLVGLDIEMANALAADLDVEIEFVRFNRQSLADQISRDDFDVVMSGLVGTLERAAAMQHTSPYMEVTLSFVVPDYRVRFFRTLSTLSSIGDLKIGFVDLSRGFVNRIQKELPNATLIELSTTHEFFEGNAAELDALLVSAETGSAYTLRYPAHEVVVPDDLQVKLPLFYAIGREDADLRGFLEHWVELRRRDGTMQQFYDHWILGRAATEKKPRWCVIRDVLNWVD